MNVNSHLTEIFAEPESPVLFIDFDGTVSQKDVIDRILEEFADERWLEIEEQWISGKIGSRECLQKQFALVKTTPAELDEFLATLKLDAGFLPLLRFCSQAKIDVHIISDGFDYYIRRMLEKVVSNRQMLNGIGIWANRLLPAGQNLWRAEFPYFEKICRDGCATCKPKVMKLNNPRGAASIFVGDGLSDRFAARTADVVFAKKKLANFCARENITFVRYENLGEVAARLERAFDAARELSTLPAEGIFDIFPLPAEA
ncbi:MAG: MtnX-like HAD-IB family phosphatase [Pyrinomonadaceae bacterium]